MIATLVGLYLFCCVIFVLSLMRAPHATEDETGFHVVSGDNAELALATPTTRWRPRARRRPAVAGRAF